MACRWRRLIIASSEEVAGAVSRHRECHSHAAQQTTDSATGQSSSNHSPKTVAEERCFKNMFMRRQPTPPPAAPATASQSRYIETEDAD